MSRQYESLAERIVMNSYPSETHAYAGERCWVWMGKVSYSRGPVGKMPAPYPVMTMRYASGPRKGKVHNVRVHRKAVEVFKGRRVTPKMVVMHLCNNSLCVNPAHLMGGTQKKNVQQCVRDGRHVTPFRK